MTPAGPRRCRHVEACFQASYTRPMYKRLHSCSLEKASHPRRSLAHYYFRKFRTRERSRDNNLLVRTLKLIGNIENVNKAFRKLSTSFHQKLKCTKLSLCLCVRCSRLNEGCPFYRVLLQNDEACQQPTASWHQEFDANEDFNYQLLHRTTKAYNECQQQPTLCHAL